MSGFDDLRVRIQADIFAGLPAHFSRLGWSEGQLRGWQRDRLRALLATASRRSAFHRRRLAGVDPARFELAGLPSLPVMTKAELMADFDAVSCDPRLTREAAEQALAATGSEPRPLPGGYLCMATGGSSGQRGIFAYDQAGVAEFASLIFRSRLAALGASPARVPEITFAMVGAPSAVHGTMFVPSMLAGSPVRFSFVPVTWPVADIVGRLNELQPDALFGYPSMLARLALEQRGPAGNRPPDGEQHRGDAATGVQDGDQRGVRRADHRHLRHLGGSGRRQRTGRPGHHDGHRQLRRGARRR